ncbi:MAG: TlpA disulfide reductase family protein [Muribaculaceae bacterium]
MMKKLLFSCAITLILVSCGSEKYKITCNYPNASLDGNTAYLMNYDTNMAIDSATIEKGTLVFQGEIEVPIIARVMAEGTKAIFVLEDGDITIDAQKRIATGTELNTTFEKFKSAEMALETSQNKNEEAFAAGKISQAKYKATDKELTAKLNKLFADTYNDNKKNPVGYYAFLQYTYEFTSAQFDSIIDDAPGALIDMKRVQTWIDSAKKKEKTAVGKKFTDFVIKSEDGIETRLSDFVGKGNYTLVDFWASWCGPCIHEAKVIKELNNEYGDKGLNILGVAVWDEPENTRNAIKRHELPWQQIINAQDIPTDLYGITGIPHIIIFAPDGTILSRGLQGNDLKAKVKEIMSKAK